MEGRILVVHSAWNPQRAIGRIVQDLDQDDTVLGGSLREQGVEEKQVHAVMAAMAKYSNLLVEGDMIALDHTLSVLRFLYDPQQIVIRNSWGYGQSDEQVVKNRHFEHEVSRSNVILLGGPRGNLVSRQLLSGAGLGWVFDRSHEYGLCVCPCGGESERLFPGRFSSTDKLRHDYGVFLKFRNPYNTDKMVLAMMGTHAYGTQGAGALACASDSALELIAAPVDPAVRSMGVAYAGWLEVKTERNTDLGSFTDPQLVYSLVYPPCPKGNWRTHKNPSAIHSTQARLRTSLLEGTVFLGTRPSLLLLYTVLLTVAVIVVSTLVFYGWLGIVSSSAIVLLSAACVKLFTLLLKPPM